MILPVNPETQAALTVTHASLSASGTCTAKIILAWVKNLFSVPEHWQCQPEHHHRPIHFRVLFPVLMMQRGWLMHISQLTHWHSRPQAPMTRAPAAPGVLARASKGMTLYLHSRFFNHYIPAFYFLNQKELEDEDCRPLDLPAWGLE